MFILLFLGVWQLNKHKLKTYNKNLLITKSNEATKELESLSTKIDNLEIVDIIKKNLQDKKKSLEKGFLFNSKDFKEIEGPLNSFPEELKQLPELVKNKSEFSIRYSGGTKKNEFRKVQGLSLLKRPSGNVLYALCKETKYYKYYNLKKIKEVKI